MKSSYSFLILSICNRLCSSLPRSANFFPKRYTSVETNWFGFSSLRIFLLRYFSSCLISIISALFFFPSTPLSLYLTSSRDRDCFAYSEIQHLWILIRHDLSSRYKNIKSLLQYFFYCMSFTSPVIFCTYFQKEKLQ